MVNFKFEPFGGYKGTMLYYNDVIITVGEPDPCRLQYKCHLQNYNKYIMLSHEVIASLLYLQATIKKETTTKEETK